MTVEAREGRMAPLDGMRGTAAIVVMMHHLSPMTMGYPLLPRGYLAVDFFFMLSGFVMARAYESRFRAGLTLAPFMAARLRRLYPTIAIGICCGAAVAAMRGMPPDMILGVLAAELLFVPWLGAGEGGIFRFDGVQWSLLFELFANVAHGRVLQRLPVRGLLVLSVVLLAVLVMVTRRFGMIAVGDRGINWFAGLPRVLCPYLTGILLARLHGSGFSLRRAPSGLAAILLLTLTLTVAGLVPSRWDGWWIDIGIVALVFPPLILCGAQGELDASALPLARATGALSYPLYAMHLPMIGLVLFVGEPLLGQGPVLLVVASTVAIGGAVLVQRVTMRRRPAAARDREPCSIEPAPSRMSAPSA